MIRKCWAEHSLTIVVMVLGLVFAAVALPFREGTTFDAVIGLAHGCFTAGLLNVLAGRLREKNKPEL